MGIRLKEALFIGLGTLLSVGLNGCGEGPQKLFLKEISGKSARYESMRQTEKVILGSKREEEKIVLLNYLFDRDAKSEKFIISIYPDDEKLIEGITLEGSAARSLKRIDKSLAKRYTAGIVPPWFVSYEAIFPKKNLKKFRLMIPDGRDEKSIFFYKERRYIVDKKSMGKIF
jgi:hypothetical protein